MNNSKFLLEQATKACEIKFEKQIAEARAALATAEKIKEAAAASIAAAEEQRDSANVAKAVAEAKLAEVEAATTKAVEKIRATAKAAAKRELKREVDDEKRRLQHTYACYVAPRDVEREAERWAASAAAEQARLRQQAEQAEAALAEAKRELDGLRKSKGHVAAQLSAHRSAAASTRAMAARTESKVAAMQQAGFRVRGGQGGWNQS